MQVYKLAKDGEEYWLVRRPPGFDADAITFQRSREDKAFLATFWRNGRAMELVSWDMEEYYKGADQKRLGLLTKAKSLWKRISEVDAKPWPRLDLKRIKARNPFNLIAKTGYAIFDIEYIILGWIYSPFDSTSAAGSYKVISGRWYKEVGKEDLGYSGTIRLYPLSEGAVEVEQVIRSPPSGAIPILETALSLYSIKYNFQPTIRRRRMICQSYVNLPGLKLKCLET